MKSSAEEPLKPWQAPELVEVGHVSEVVQGGNAKLTASAEDSGDAGKPPGQQ